MASLLRKRQEPLQQHSNTHNTDETRRNRAKTRKRNRNYANVALYAAVFVSSPLILLFFVVRTPSFSANKSLIPISNNRHLHLSTKNSVELKTSRPNVRFKRQTNKQLGTGLRARNQNFHPAASGVNLSASSVHAQQQKSLHHVNGIPTDAARGITSVLVWPYSDYGAGTAELKHFAENGIRESPFLKMTSNAAATTFPSNIHNNNNNTVWIGHFGFAFPPNHWCQAFSEVIQQEQEKRRKQQRAGGADTDTSIIWPIHIVDWSDQTNMPQCLQIEETMGREHVQYYIRDVVTGRRWNETIQWVDIGNLSPLPPNYHHVPLFVRTDTVEALDAVLQQEYEMQLSDSIETLDRPVDVSHFWPLDLMGVREVNHAKLRQRVSHIIQNLDSNTSSTPPIRTFVGLAGNALQAGRRSVHSDYIQAMLHSKIIVVTQRDDWEDHYRLFEALVSGAMVMTDRMLSMPNGLEHGISIIEFESEVDLRDKILYYVSHKEERIEIAKRGREVAMRQHRTFHRVEQVVFGREMSNCSLRNGGDQLDMQCPWTVHTPAQTS